MKKKCHPLSQVSARSRQLPSLPTPRSCRGLVTQSECVCNSAEDSCPRAHASPEQHASTAYESCSRGSVSFDFVICGRLNRRNIGVFVGNLRLVRGGAGATKAARRFIYLYRACPWRGIFFVAILRFLYIVDVCLLWRLPPPAGRVSEIAFRGILRRLFGFAGLKQKQRCQGTKKTS